MARCQPMFEKVRLNDYIQKKRDLRAIDATTQGRRLCTKCRQAYAVCDCASFIPFSTETDFVILMHPEESRRKIATGRMTHLLMKNSSLLIGESFASELDPYLNDATRHCVVLYPGSDAFSISESEALDRKNESAGDVAWRNPDHRLTVFVLDGTWRTAKKMLRLTPRLHTVSKISFSLNRKSTFRIRKQPADYCFSTLEAIHHVLACVEPQTLERDRLIEAFDTMVERQIKFAHDRKTRDQADRDRNVTGSL